jgi:hypothetical protein
MIVVTYFCALWEVEVLANTYSRQHVEQNRGINEVPRYGPQLCIVDGHILATCIREVGKNNLMCTGAKIIGMVNRNSIVRGVSVRCIVLHSRTTIQLN